MDATCFEEISGPLVHALQSQVDVQKYVVQSFKTLAVKGDLEFKLVNEQEDNIASAITDLEENVAICKRVLT